MSNIWQHVSKQNPCPICQKIDWCQFGDRAMKCMRVESSHSCPSGGWYHFYEEKNKPEFIPKSKAPPKSIPAENIMKELRANTHLIQYEIAAEALGVLKESLIAIGAAWHAEKNAWAFPMHDSAGNVVGIRLRAENGFKWAIPGSRNGLFIPMACVEKQKVVFLPEGATDTCALLSLGFYTIGRPTNVSGNDQLALCLKRLGIFRAVIVADNDEIKQIGNREGRPGIEGALKLKKDLKIPTAIWIPPSPIKDVRDFVKRGGTKQQIESDINNKIWTKGDATKL